MIADSTFRFAGTYRYASVRSVANPEKHLLVAREEDEITVVTHEENLAGRRRNGSQDTAGRRGFSAAALSDQRQRLALIQKKAHVVDRLHQADGLMEKGSSNREMILKSLVIEEHGLA